jgi:hypothetical protein
MSQRQEVMARNGDTVVGDKNFLVPTGLISKDEISDSSFRSEFATLNHNGLATKVNPLTNRVEYDFIPMLPNNFDGSFKNKLYEGAHVYNNLSGVTGNTADDPRNLHGDTEYTRTIEENSVDYYDFRLGVGNNDWNDNGRTIQDKYLIIDNYGMAYLPMYNNSYYFYFGLKDGSTALDRFYKEFFASCPDGEEEKTAENDNLETNG